MYCTLNNNINNNCNGLHGGGIRSELRLYKINDCKVTTDGLTIKNIEGDSYLLYAESLEYKQSEENGIYTHTLNGKVLDIATSVKENLYSSRNDRFLVVYRTKGSSQIDAFGIKFGAVISFGETITNEESGFSFELKSVSNYPLYSVEQGAIDVYGKVYHKRYVPSTEQCEVNGDGDQTGYIVANYLVAVNSNNQPLDTDGHLCSESGELQSAYKLQGLPISNYHIEGDYIAGANIEGTSTRRYDGVDCVNELSGTITLNTNSITLNTTDKVSQDVQITCSGSWSVLDAYAIEYCKLSAISGQGNATITFSGALGGSESIRIINNETREVVTLEVNTYVVQLQSTYESRNELMFAIPCRAIGGAGTFSALSSASNVEMEVVGNTLQFTLNETPDAETVFNVVVTHNSDEGERKSMIVTIHKGADNEPHWVKVAQYCEVE